MLPAGLLRRPREDYREDYRESSLPNPSLGSSGFLVPLIKMHFVAGFLNNRQLSVPIMIWDLGAINSPGDSCSSSEGTHASQSISQALQDS